MTARFCFAGAHLCARAFSFVYFSFAFTNRRSTACTVFGGLMQMMRIIPSPPAR